MPANQYESIDVEDTAIGFTTALLRSEDDSTRCDRVFITAETAQMRFRYDGTAPTDTEGHLLNVGDPLVLDDHQSITDFKAIRTGSTSGVLKVTFEYPGQRVGV